jgi:hypothetical protein
MTLLADAEAGDTGTDMDAEAGTRVPPPPPGWRREVIPRKTVVETGDKVRCWPGHLPHVEKTRVYCVKVES